MKTQNYSIRVTDQCMQYKFCKFRLQQRQLVTDVVRQCQPIREQNSNVSATVFGMVLTLL